MDNEKNNANRRRKLLGLVLEAGALADAPITRQMSGKLRHGLTATLIAGTLGAAGAQAHDIDLPNAPSGAPTLEAGSLQAGGGQTQRFADGFSKDGIPVLFIAEHNDSAKTQAAGQGTEGKGPNSDLFQAVAELEELTLIAAKRTTPQPTASAQQFADEMAQRVREVTGGSSAKQPTASAQGFADEMEKHVKEATGGKIPKLTAGVKKLGTLFKALGTAVSKTTHSSSAAASGGSPGKDERKIESAAATAISAVTQRGSHKVTTPARGAKAGVSKVTGDSPETGSVVRAPSEPSRAAPPTPGMSL